MTASQGTSSLLCRCGREDVNKTEAGGARRPGWGRASGWPLLGWRLRVLLGDTFDLKGCLSCPALLSDRRAGLKPCESTALTNVPGHWRVLAAEGLAVSFHPLQTLVTSIIHLEK